MKKIGILFGSEKSFPLELIQYINSKKTDVKASSIIVGALKNIDKSNYDVIYDRISHLVPIYQSYLKMAMYNGSIVVNNPNSNCIDNNFFQTVFAKKNKLKVPKTILLPSKELPDGINPEHLQNLMYPINWDEVFDYIGFPAVLKPNKGYNLFNAYKVYNQSEFFSAYDLTGNNPMILQENIEYDVYYRAFTIGKNDVRIVEYNPNKPIHLRYNRDATQVGNKIGKEINKIALTISDFFELYFNTVEIAVKDNVPYIINFLNPAPNCDRDLMWEDDFMWLIEKTGDMLINLE